MWKRLRAIDLSLIILAIGMIVRIDAAGRFDLRHGYDAAAHLDYSKTLKRGRIPRAYTPGTWARQNPPLYYALALRLSALGFGLAGGVIISLLAGAFRLFSADYAFRRVLGLSPQARHFANAVHAFLPFSIRMDIFYSPESLGVALALAAVLVALRGRPVVSGVVLGLALLTKASCVAAVPAVAYALTFGQGLRLHDREALIGAGRRLITAGLVSAALLGQWAWPNIVKCKTPYPSIYTKDRNPAWKRPFFRRHAPRFYRPRLVYRALTWPYYTDRVSSAPNAWYLEAWGDFYNYLNRGPTRQPPPRSANGRAVNPKVHKGYVVLVHVGFIFVAFLFAGFVGFVLRAVRSRAPPGESVLAIMGICYLLITILFGIGVVKETHGAVKATYALGATAIFSAWAGRAFDWIAQQHWSARFACVVVCAIPALIAIYQRLVW